MPEMTCRVCLHTWTYKGKSTVYCTCPFCRAVNRIPIPPPAEGSPGK